MGKLGGKGKAIACNLYFVYFFLPHLLIGKNSWRRQPGTFLIMNPLLPMSVLGQRVQFRVV